MIEKATVDCYNESEQVTGFFAMIDDNLEVPFETLFLSLRTPDEAIARVALRVRQGGHNVPPDVVKRRFETGMKNFLEVYRHRVDYWQWFDNSGRTPQLLDEGTNQ